MKLIKRLRNIWNIGEVEIKEGKLLPLVKVEEKPRMAEIIRMKDEEKIISDLIEDK